jgi:hypothetical protein
LPYLDFSVKQKRLTITHALGPVGGACFRMWRRRAPEGIEGAEGNKTVRGE